VLQEVAEAAEGVLQGVVEAAEAVLQEVAEAAEGVLQEVVEAGVVAEEITAVEGVAEAVGRAIRRTAR
jgi:hypothetical protein